MTAQVFDFFIGYRSPLQQQALFEVFQGVFRRLGSVHVQFVGFEHFLEYDSRRF